MSDIPPAPSSPCEVEPLLKQVLQVAGPLLVPPTTPSTTSHTQNLDQSSAVPLSQTMQKKKSENDEDASQVETDLAKDSSRGSAVKEPVRHLSSLSALMVTLGPHGFMIMRRCEEGTEDSPLLTRSKQPPSDSGVVEDFIGDEGTYHSLERVAGLYFPPPDYDQIVSVSGAGDCLASGFITGMLAGLRVSECAAVGNTAARLSLQALATVPHTLGGLRAVEGGECLHYKLIC